MKIDLQIADASIAAFDVIASGSASKIEQAKQRQLHMLKEKELVLQQLNHDFKCLRCGNTSIDSTDASMGDSFESKTSSNNF